MPRLLSIEDVPPYLATNKSLRHGYRQCHSWVECVRSLRHWSNSQWSSITSLLVVAYGCVTLGVAVHLDDGALFAMALNAFIHGPPSAAYHIFGEAVGMGERVFEALRHLDYVAIHVASIPLAYALCVAAARVNPALVVCAPLAVGGTIWRTCRAVAVPAHTPLSRVRGIGTVVAFYMIPVAGIIVVAPWTMFGALGMGIVGALLFGTVVYVAQFPECVVPTHWFGSHAPMHVAVAMAYACEVLLVALSK